MTGEEVKIIQKKTEKKYIMKNPTFEKLINDDKLEEIAVNGPDEPVFIFHRDYGRCKTNLNMSEEEILDFIGESAEKSANYINKSKPFLDARLTDGSRLNATIPPATPKGPTMTISKFRERPFSMIDLIDNGTLSYSSAAFLWAMIEGEGNYPMNTLIIGGTGAGKTTTLNTLVTFVPIKERITCIEDTLELNFFGRENVIRMVSVPPMKSREPITMNDLLENALRMRPDRLVVGEVRGKEAGSLFNAMNVGHSAIGTLHANSPSELTARLTNSPMNVPKNMLPLIDIVVVQKKIVQGSDIKRRVSSITEVSRSELGVSFNELFTYNEELDEIEKTANPSRKLERLASLSGKNLKGVQRDIKEKEEFLRELVRNNTRGLANVSERVQDYYSVKYFSKDKNNKIN
ncbi:MAG: type II/IV secretion system ATPase subunit [archaeon]